MLDADSVEWFKQNGGLTRANGDHFRDTLLSRGGSADALVLFKDFTGRDPYIEPLLVRRGLTATSADDTAKPDEKPSDTPSQQVSVRIAEKAKPPGAIRAVFYWDV